MDPSMNEIINSEQRYLHHDKISTSNSITTEGLEGKWAISDFKIDSSLPDFPTTDDASIDACVGGEILLRRSVHLLEIAEKFIRPYKWGGCLPTGCKRRAYAGDRRPWRYFI
jgi:hypothetical protein